MFVRLLFLSCAVLGLLASSLHAQEASATAEPVEAIELPAVDLLTVHGEILIAGSSTVYPLTLLLAQAFIDEGFSGTIKIDPVGTGVGFERFCISGDTDISNASRAIQEAEIENCRAIGREPVEFRVGTDALVIVVSAANDFADDLTLEELRTLFSTARRWSDLRAAWPDERILRYTPGTDSGTFDYFVEAVFDGEMMPLLRANPQLSEDDHVLVSGVSSSPYAVGFFGFAYYSENRELLRALAIEGVEPGTASVEDGSYPLARPLFIYSATSIIQTKSQVAAFLNYYLTHVSDLVLEAGYFPASVEALNEARQRWLDALGELPR